MQIHCLSLTRNFNPVCVLIDFNDRHAFKLFSHIMLVTLFMTTILVGRSTLRCCVGGSFSRFLIGVFNCRWWLAHCVCVSVFILCVVKCWTLFTYNCVGISANTCVKLIVEHQRLLVPVRCTDSLFWYQHKGKVLLEMISFWITISTYNAWLRLIWII